MNPLRTPRPLRDIKKNSRKDRQERKDLNKQDFALLCVLCKT